MNVLAFDTCFAACSAAVRLERHAAGAPVIALRFEPMAAGHAERLLPMIGELLEEAGCAFADLDALAVTEGPGTFTGIRVGVAAARGLALATGLPVRAATSLHVMAAGAARELAGELPGHDLAVCADARNGQVFAQLFSADLAPLGPALLAAPHDVANGPGDRPLLCVGSAAEAVARAARHGSRGGRARLPLLLPAATDLAALAPALPVRSPPVPLYLRSADATAQAGRSLPRAP